MRYFTIEELCASSTGERLHLDNTPTPAARRNLERLVAMVLDPVRELWGMPLTVNSGYRSRDVNSAVHGVWNSQHLRGEAADITTGTATNNALLFRKIAAAWESIPFDQLILEPRAGWLHISYTDRRKPRWQILDRR